MTESARSTPIRFGATVTEIDRTTVLRLPKTASEKLPSRGQVAVIGTMNGHAFRTVVEPDGMFGHWIRVDAKLKKTASFDVAVKIAVELAPTKAWPEPSVPADLRAALAAAPIKIQDLWNEITPMARWEWVRWLNATRNSETRKRRVEVTISKMNSGKRRPCCFDLAACTDPELSKSGKLVAGF